MEEYEGHIGVKEGIVLVFTLLIAPLFLQVPQFLVEIGGPAGWQVALVMTGAAMVILLPLVALAQRFPQHGLAEISIEAAGPILGPLLTLPVSLWLLVATAMTLRNFTETFMVAILPETPPSVLTLVAAGCAVFASYKGIETIGRATQILLPLILGGCLLVLLFSWSRVDTSLSFPFWGHGLVNTLTGGAYYASTTAEVIALLGAGYAFRSGKDLRSSALVGTLLYGGTATVIAWLLVTIFGAPGASQNPFPLYNLARLVYLGRFLQRTESLIVMLWFFAAAVRVSILLHGSAVTLGGALRLPLYRPLLFPLAVILVAVALVPTDYLSVLRIERDWLRPTGLGVLAIPLLLWLLAAVRGKGVTAHEA